MVRQNTRWRDTVDQNVGQIHAGKGAAPGLTGEGRRSDSNRCRGLGDPEPGALLLPDDGEAGVARKLLRGQFDRMAVAEDRFDDIRREEAKPQDSGEVGTTDLCLLGKFGDCFSAAAQSAQISEALKLAREWRPK